jgi:anthranilate synthase component 1
LKPFILNTHYKQILADTITPVSIYFKIRDKFPNSLLLESSDYHGNDNSFSYICCNPIATIKIENEVISKTFPDGTTVSRTSAVTLLQQLKSKMKSFQKLSLTELRSKLLLMLQLIFHK